MAGTARRDDPLAVVTRQLLHDQHAAVVSHITAEVFARQHSYAQMRDTSGYHAAVSHLVRLYCCTIAEDRRVDAEEMVALNIIGAHRAREGINEGEMVESLNTAVVAGFAFLVRVLADICPSTDAMGPAVTTAFERTRMFSEDIEAGLRAGHNTEHDQRLPAHLRTQATAVDLILEGPTRSDDDLCSAARSRGLRLTPAFGLLLVTGTQDVSGLRAAATALASRCDGAVEGSVRLGRPVHVPIVVDGLSVPGANDDEPTTTALFLEPAGEVARAHDVVVVVAPRSTRAGDLNEAYRTSAAVLKYAQLASPFAGVTDVDELHLYRLLDSIPPAVRTDYALQVLAGLTALPPGKQHELLDTFRAWIVSRCNAKEAAALLHLHPQSVRWRLRRLAKLLDVDLGGSPDRLVVEAAVRIYLAWIEPIRTADPAPEPA